MNVEEQTDLNEFFVVALPGLEDLVLSEIHSWYPNLKTKSEHGGITVFATMEAGLSLNLVLKTATRVLLRIKRFRCRDFPKLFNFVTKIPWEQYIALDCEMDVEVSTRLSRLKMKNRIKETCVDAWVEHVLKNKKTITRGKSAKMFIRLHNDDCTVSLDTSGDRLHKRGLKVLIGEAPLRETIAASLVRLVMKSDLDAKYIDVIDPMMGSGTFLLEALITGRILNERDFAFNVFSKQICKRQLDEINKIKNDLNVVRVVGYESDKKTFDTAKENLKENASTVELNLNNEDFFKTKPSTKNAVRRWVFCNPPYGERIKVEGNLKEYYQNLFSKTEEVFSPDRACFVLPAAVVKGKFVLPNSWKVIEKRPFVNGGIPVVAFVFSRSS